MLDGKKAIEMKVPWIMKLVEKKALRKISGTVIEDLLKEYNVI